MSLRAIDFHVHLPTPDWLDGSMAGYVEAAEAYFRSPAQRQSLDQLAAQYRRLGVKAVLLAWDAETATGRPRVPNETVAAACRDYPDVFTGLGSVDPLKGDVAVAEVANIASLGLRGVKFHPSLQAFSPDDAQYWPVFAACERHGLLALFHTGTSGIGARQPGGQGIRIDLAHPLKLDSVAAAHPDLTVVAAHFGWPWHMDLIAIALHKTNVYIDISGWTPRRIPAEVIRELRGAAIRPVPVGQRLPVLHARAMPVRARGPGAAGRGHERGAARQRGPHPQLRSTTTGAWSDGPLPLRASRSTYAACTRSATASVAYTRSIRMPLFFANMPAR